jgi:hypothetical protein
MAEFIYPRSPREMMDGWAHLPRYIDKIRLHLAGKLSVEYRDNFGKNSDEIWLKSAGVSHDQMIEVVHNTITDGEVYDWVRVNIRRTAAEKEAHRRAMLDFPPPEDAKAVEYFNTRKAAYVLGYRADVRNRADLLDADEGRF